MTSEEYCKQVQERDLSNKSLIPTTSISENYSSLVSLKDAELNVIYTPSSIEGSDYLVRQGIIGKISRISDLLERQNKQLVIYSTWCSLEDQRVTWEKRMKTLKEEFPDKPDSEIDELIARFISLPENSMHLTGGAVDALIYDKEKAEAMDFGTNEGFNIHLNDQCYPYHPDISPIAQENRKLLIDLFENEDFVVDVKKYWHFNYGNVIWAIEKEKRRAIYGVIKE